MYFLFGFVGFVSLYVFCFILSILYRSLRAYCRKCCGHEDDDVERYVKLQEQIAQDKQNTSKSRRNHQVPQGAQQLIWYVNQATSCFLVSALQTLTRICHQMTANVAIPIN